MTDDPPNPQPAGARRRTKRVVLALGLLTVATLLLTTRLGVWVFLDVLGSFEEEAPQLDPAAGPVVAEPFAGSITSLPMPPSIQQPSGIAFDPATRTWAISTDQAELLVLDESMGQVLSRQVLLRMPPLFRQGLIEAVAFVPGVRPGDDRLAFTGETGTIELWRRQADETPGWVRDTSLPLDPELSELEASALAWDPSTQTFWIASSEHSILYGIDANGSLVRQLDLATTDRWPPGVVKPGRRVDELAISGLTLFDGHLWAVTENTTTLFRLDPRSGNVVDLWALSELGEASDLALVEGTAVFTIDHNWNAPRPSFRQLALPEVVEPAVMEPAVVEPSVTDEPPGEPGA